MNAINRNNKKLSQESEQELISILKARFVQNMSRHEQLEWPKLHARLQENSQKLWSLYEMERSGGEPDVVAYDKKTDEFIFYDCSLESPIGRRSICYDRAGLESRKAHKPDHNAIDMATEMGIALLTVDQYKVLQQLGNFDTKTSSWLQTPEPIRKLGGAIFADFRYGQVFIYHNGAESYFSARAFRGCLNI